MDEFDPRRQIDPFTAALVAKLRTELEIAVKKLACSDTDLALAQVERLRENAVYRLKNWDFDLDVVASGLPEDDVVKVIAITLAAVGESLDQARDYIVERDKLLYGDDADDDAAE